MKREVSTLTQGCKILALLRPRWYFVIDVSDFRVSVMISALYTIPLISGLKAHFKYSYNLRLFWGMNYSGKLRSEKLENHAASDTLQSSLPLPCTRRQCKPHCISWPWRLLWAGPSFHFLLKRSSLIYKRKWYLISVIPLKRKTRSVIVQAL